MKLMVATQQREHRRCLTIDRREVNQCLDLSIRRAPPGKSSDLRSSVRRAWKFFRRAGRLHPQSFGNREVAFSRFAA
jgi:hypothetical protein